MTSRIVLAILLAATSLAAEPPVRVLIVEGYSNHDWRLTTAGCREPGKR